MTTRLYMRGFSDLSTPCVFCTGNGDANARGTRGSWENCWLSLSPGAAQTGDTTNTVTGPTAGIEAESGGIPAHFISPPLDNDVTISGSISVNLWGVENSMNANVGLAIIIERIRGSDASIVSTIASSTAIGLELGTTAAVRTASLTPTSTNMLKGDRIRVRVLYDDASGATMASGFTATFNFAGPTAGANGDSYIEFTETFGLLTTTPSSTKTYFTDTASDVATAAVDREIWTSKGSGLVTDVTNTVTTGYITPLQVTDTGGGTVVDWWTRPLSAFTLSAPVLVNCWALENNTNADATIRFQLAVVDNDGSNPTVWGENCSHTELTTSATNRIFFLSGDDISVADQKRLRVRVFVDDAGAPVQSGWSVTFDYGGTTNGADGDSYLQFPSALSEFTAAALPPILLMARVRT